jgi:hypothetical protein
MDLMHPIQPMEVVRIDFHFEFVSKRISLVSESIQDLSAALSGFLPYHIFQVTV